MKLLPDSNIFIDFWESKTDFGKESEKVFTEEDIVTCGAVRAELLHGAVSEKHFKAVTAMLDGFDEYNLEPEAWQQLGTNLYKLRINGLTVPFADAIIATVAIINNLTVWSRDRHFVLMSEVLDGLKVRYQPSAPSGRLW